MLSAALLAILPSLVSAKPVVEKRWTASEYVGSTTTDLYPPTGTSADIALFPNGSQLGYPGVTLTGIEPAAIQTAPAFPAYTGAVSHFPLIADQPQQVSDPSTPFDIFKYFGNLAPWYSVPSSFYGLPKASPLIPPTCEITQVHYLYRHGARYPTTGAAPSAFAARLRAAVTNGTQPVIASGELEFLDTWTYKIGSELLTPFGRLQNFALGVEARQQYGVLLNNFTETSTIPVFRTESQDRMVKTAENFAAGFFGVPEYLSEVNIEIVVEATGFNNSGASYETCTNANVASRGSIGSAAASKFANNAFNSTIARLQGQIEGYTLTPTDAVAMLQLCSYETDALGYSKFCGLFTEEDFRNYEYYYDISFYYNNGFGSPVAAAQGKGYLQEFISRFTQSTTPFNGQSTANTTLDKSPIFFPLNQSIYADATHEVIVLDTLAALNLTALFSTGPLPVDERDDGSSFVASQTVPFGTHLVVQVMECGSMTPSKQMRNDAVLPIDQSYAGCPADENGLCAFETVVEALKARDAEIDYEYACFGNYTAEPGMDYNGLPPKRA